MPTAEYALFYLKEAVIRQRLEVVTGSKEVLGPLHHGASLTFAVFLDYLRLPRVLWGIKRAVSQNSAKLGN